MREGQVEVKTSQVDIEESVKVAALLDDENQLMSRKNI